MNAPALKWTDGIAVRSGQMVRCERARPSSGTWRNYAGRIGTVILTNKGAKEVGVEGKWGNKNRVAVAWFALDEVVRLTRK